jgi:glycosyltransferase involved in cell wall biosynthesis
MKVLFIGPYRQNDGWGESARALIEAILTTDIDLTIRHVALAPSLIENSKLYSKYEILENKTSDKYDVIIQNALPEFFVYYEGCKNIGMFCIETSNIQYTPWITYTNLMDEIWVHSQKEILILQDSGCTKPIYNIGSAIDIDKFNKQYSPKTSKDFIFYTIGEGERKNFLSLLIAFHREFDRNEPVSLIIKESGNSDELKQVINNIKDVLKIYVNKEQYKTETLITQRLSEEELNLLHYQSDCFVMPSYGEAWCRPALDALGFGKTPIVTDNTGMNDFINNNNGWLVPSVEIPVVVNRKPLPYLYTARETWRNIDILALQKYMRQAYEDKALKNIKTEQGQKDINYYSYENMGKRIHGQLHS